MPHDQPVPLDHLLALAQGYAEFAMRDPMGRWNSVRLTFERAGYLRFQTNFSLSMLAANTSEGVPLLDAGQIFLREAPGQGKRR